MGGVLQADQRAPTHTGTYISTYRTRAGEGNAAVRIDHPYARSWKWVSAGYPVQDMTDRWPTVCVSILLFALNIDNPVSCSRGDRLPAQSGWAELSTTTRGFSGGWRRFLYPTGFTAQHCAFSRAHTFPSPVAL